MTEKEGVTCPAVEADGPALAGFITDAEGNLEYFQRCVDLSRVVCFDTTGKLQFARVNPRDIFVFGGDSCDKGDGDIRIAEALISFKDQYPERVHLLVGNRELNKIRVSAELRETEIDVPYPVPQYPGADEPKPLRQFLTEINGGSEDGIDAVNTRANRLRWMLDITLGAGGMFEKRRKELSNLRGCEVTDDDVVDSYLHQVESDDGVIWRYLTRATFALQWGDTLFIHGGVPDGAPGWVPPVDMQWVSPPKGAECPGEVLPEGHTLKQWIAAMNQRMREGMQHYRDGLCWREGRRRGGEMLLCWQSTPACYLQSVIVESALSMGTPKKMPEHVAEYLSTRGIRRIVSGHKPCGDSPFALRSGIMELLCCDTTYSDKSARDKRGAAVAAVEITEAPRSRTVLHGTLANGATYGFTLPPPGEDAEAGTDDDPYVGHQTDEGWWVKAVLSDGSYHCAQSKEGSRGVQYKSAAREELASASWTAF